MQQQPTFTMSGLASSQRIHYRVVSRLELDPPAADGTRNVVQYVEGTQLLEADELSRGTFVESLARLKGQQYTYAVNQRGEVIRFTGHKSSRTEIPVDLGSATGLMVTSVIDEDGWKELAELTFFVPEQQASPSAQWQRQMTHDWGSLGRWSGTTTFAVQQSQREVVPITFVHEMTYQAAEPAAGLSAIRIAAARFVPQQAAGTIEYDTRRQRVVKAHETFEVTGDLQAEFLGQPVAIELAETQHITIEVLDERPAQILTVQ